MTVEIALLCLVSAVLGYGWGHHAGSKRRAMSAPATPTPPSKSCVVHRWAYRNETGGLTACSRDYWRWSLEDVFCGVCGATSLNKTRIAVAEAQAKAERERLIASARHPSETAPPEVRAKREPKKKDKLLRRAEREVEELLKKGGGDPQ